MPTNRITTWIRQWGGVAQNCIPEDIPLGMFMDALNFEMTRSGPSPRLGASLFASTAATDGKTILTIYPADFDGTIRLMVATSDHVYEFITSTGTWSTVYTFTNKGYRTTFALLNANAVPTLVFGNGKDALQKWNGTTCSACGGGAPIGNPVAYKNYLAVFNIPSAPGKVQFCINNGDPDVWTIGGTTQRYLEMRGKVTSVFPYGGLVIATANRTELFSGDPDQVIGMTVLSESTGVVSHATVQDCDGILFWLAQAGVMCWDGGGKFPLANVSDPPSAAGEPAKSNIQDCIDQIDWSQANMVSACYNSVNKAYYLSAKLSAVAGGVSFWRTLVYHTDFAAWFPWDLEVTASAVMISPSTNRPIFLSGTTAGALRQYGATNMEDAVVGSSATYEYWARTGDHDFGDPDHAKIFRGLILGTAGVVGAAQAGDRTLTIQVRGEFSRTDTDDLELDANAGGFILGVNRLGEKLTDAYRYMESRVPMAIRTKHLNLLFFGRGSTNALAISALAYIYIPHAPRDILVGGR